MDYNGREFSMEEMTTVLFVGWITFIGNSRHPGLNCVEKERLNTKIY